MSVRIKCSECGEVAEYGDICQSCCEHGDMDDGHCLDCGKDRREDLMSDAYDYYKDRMKYGDD